MKTHLKTLSSLAVMAGFALAGHLHAQIFSVTDSFDTYATGNRTHGQTVTIPGTSPARVWDFRSAASPIRTQGIYSASAFGGRSGQVYSLDTTLEAGNTVAFLATGTNGVSNGLTSWTLSLDFYVDTLTNDGKSLMLVSAFLDPSNVNNRLFSFSVNNSVANGLRGVMSIGATAVGGDDSRFFTGLAEDTWYSLAINGNHLSQTITFTLSDGVNAPIVSDTYYYRKDVQDIARVTLGDLSAVAKGRAAIDNFSYMAVPEPASVAMLLGAALLLGLPAFRRRRLPGKR